MPCYVTGSAEGDAQLAAREAREAATLATRLLCEVMEVLPDGIRDGLYLAVPGLPVWWSKHQQIDRERKAREAEYARREELDRRTEEFRRQEERRMEEESQ